MEPHNKILTPPNKEKLKNWIIEKYGDDFEPDYLNKIVDNFSESTLKHKEYSKKKSLLYIGKHIIKLDRIYRKQESLYWIKRGWDIKIAEEKRVIRNKDWYIRKYGVDEGIIKYNDKNVNISNNCGHTLEKYIARYGNIEGVVKYDDYKKGCARNLEFFVKKYGEDNGLKKYKIFKKHIGKASHESLLVFTPLIEWLSNIIDNKEIYYGNIGSREYFLVDNGKTYLYDLTIKLLKLIIEFNGVKFHVNENWSLEEKKKWKHPFNSLTYEDAIKNDKFKKELAENNGFSVLTIWSDTPVEENIELCKIFINDKINERN